MDNPTTGDTTVPTTETPISEVPSAAEPSVPAGELVAAGSTSAAVLVTPNGQPIESATSSEVTGADPVIETKTYADGTSATGVAPLPDLSPTEQAMADGQHTGTLADITQVGDHTVVTDISQTGNQLAGSGNVLVNETPTIDAPVLEGETVTVANVENDLNPLVLPAGTEGAPASQIAAAQAEGEVEPLPRESHLMLLEHKLDAMYAKFKSGERIVIDEFEQILGHFKALR